MQVLGCPLQAHGMEEEEGVPETPLPPASEARAGPQQQSAILEEQLQTSKVCSVPDCVSLHARHVGPP
jgi:hypothetical protein